VKEIAPNAPNATSVRMTVTQPGHTSYNRRARRISLWIAIAVNALFLLLLYAAQTRLAERTWFTGGLVCLPQVVFAVPLAMLLVWSAIERDRVAIALNVVVGILFVFRVMGINVPLGRSHGGSTIRIMTYNIHQGARGIRRVRDVIEDLSPDILCVQEVNSWGKWGDPVRQLQQLTLGWHIVRDGELAIFSRPPIISHAVHYLPSGTGRAILEARLRVKGRELVVLNTHFNLAAKSDLPGWYRMPLPKRISKMAAVMDAQARELMMVASASGESVIITGDFNMPPRWLACRKITSRYRDAFRAAGWGFGYTFPTRLPLARIDYILIGRSLGVRGCFSPRTRASDHLPVVADIVW
jgi:vancomycin resistance protein VanJ